LMGNEASSLRAIAIKRQAWHPKLAYYKKGANSNITKYRIIRFP